MEAANGWNGKTFSVSLTNYSSAPSFLLFLVYKQNFLIYHVLLATLVRCEVHLL